MPVYLEGLAIGFYRGIGPETQYIAPFSGMNLFVGANNSGKSVVLKAISERLPFSSGIKPSAIEVGSVDAYRGSEAGSDAFFAVGVTPESVLNESLEHIELAKEGQPENHIKSLVRVLPELMAEDGAIWFLQSSDINPHSGAIRFSKTNLVTGLNAEALATGVPKGLWLKEIRELPARRRAHAQVLAVQRAWGLQKQVISFSFPPPLIIPAKRELGPTGESFDDQTGKGLIDHLAQLQNPGLNEQDLKAKFEAINDFLQVVTGKPDARLEVPSNKEYLLVHMDGKVLPLDSFGTGIHEVVLIAAYCTIHQQRIMCIEEPEIHLHPVLQRKLIRYLQDKTENQYFIATHSNAFIDTPGASVFRVWNDGVQTRVRAAITTADKRSVCDDLGVRASDILQANAVVWVEGPSDRIYIRAWLKVVAPELREGIEYSIMIYGGGLLSHLSADDEAVGDFIALRHLNRNFAVVMDSDRSGARKGPKPAVVRIRDELDGDQNYVWITKGREIENYVSPDVLHDALKAVHPKLYEGRCEVGPYDHAFYFERKTQKDVVYKNADKGRVASEVVAVSSDVDVLDLRKRLEGLAAMIRRANGLAASDGGDAT